MAERKYGVEAAGAGDAGKVLAERELGPCPGCGAMLLDADLRHPHTGKPARGILHPVPFCNYYGATDPEDIEADIARARALS